MAYRHLKKIDDAARDALAKISAAGKDLKRAEDIAKAAGGSHDERRVVSARANLLDAQDAHREAVKAAERILDSLRGTRAEAVRDAVKSTALNPEHIDTAGLELLKLGIAAPSDMDIMRETYKNNPTMLRVLAKFAGDAASATEEPRTRTAYNTVAQFARDATNPDADGEAIDGLMHLFERCIHNESMIKDYSALAQGFMN